MQMNSTVGKLTSKVEDSENEQNIKGATKVQPLRKSVKAGTSRDNSSLEIKPRAIASTTKKN